MIIPLAKPNVTPIVFSDINPLVGYDDPYELVYDEDCIFKSIVTILSTKIGSRVFNRRFGSKIEDYLWDPMDSVTAGKIKTDITDSLKRWEPRIKLSKVTVVPDQNEVQYYVNIEYTIPTLGDKPSSFVFNLTRS